VSEILEEPNPPPIADVYDSIGCSYVEQKKSLRHLNIFQKRLISIAPTIHFIWTAHVELEQLRFDKPPSDETFSNITRLQGILRIEGCFPLEPDNRIVATIEEGLLQEVLRTSGINQ
jgi:hypothetical protein